MAYLGYVREGDKFAILLDLEEMRRLVTVLGQQSDAKGGVPSVLDSLYFEMQDKEDDVIPEKDAVSGERRWPCKMRLRHTAQTTNLPITNWYIEEN